MKGLLLKDWYVLWKYAKWNLGLALAFIVFSILDMNPVFPLISVLFFSMLPLTSMGLDERCRWDSFASTMPFSRMQLVLSRYLIALMGTMMCVILFIVVFLIGSVVGIQTSSINTASDCLYLMGFVGALIPALTLPISFKIGVEKSRITYLLVCALITAGITVFFNITNTSASDFNVFSGLPAAGAPIIALVLLVISAYISVQIYKRKDL